MRKRLAGWISVAAVYGLLAGAGVTGWSYFEPVRVAGGSMEPALFAGDVVLVRRNAAVHDGDIVLVREPGHSAVLHRVLDTARDGSLRLKGDANPVPDLETVRTTYVAGRVARVIPVGALLRRWRDR